MIKKPIFLFLLVCAQGMYSFAQSPVSVNKTTPEKQISFAKENKPHDYYVKQAELWWAEVQKDNTSENNWYNYYRACRSAQGTFGWKEDFVKESPVLRLGADIVELMKKHIPDTFTYNYVMGSTGGADPQSGSYLMKAYAVNLGFEGIQSDVVTYAHSIGDSALRANANKEWYSKNEMSPGLLSYAYNLLQSVDSDSILLTQHDNDSYPVWMLQDVWGIKKNVKVINIDFLIHGPYREKIFKELNISQTELPGRTINEWETNWKTIVHYILTNYKGKNPLNVSLTLYPSLYEEFMPRLSISGLALKLAQKPAKPGINNQQLIQDNFLLDYIKFQVSNETSGNYVNEQNLNYLKSFKLAYNSLKAANQPEQAKKIKDLSLLIASRDENKKTIESVRADFR